MVKVKVLSRNPDHYQRETKNDIFKVPVRNGGKEDPLRHAVEYTRALNAAKLERVFAKPFIGSFDGHNEGVSVLAKHPLRLGYLFSGARDGQVKIWRLSNRKCLSTTQAHAGPVNGISVDGVSGELFATIGQDAQLKHWNLAENIVQDLGEPAHSVPLSYVPHSISHLYDSTDFVVSGEGISYWKLHRDTPVRTYDLGPNTVHSVRSSPVEATIVAGCASDRSVFLLDTRQKYPVHRIVMSLRPNNICWNPIEAYNFVAASDDYNLYGFDMRNMSAASNVYGDHTAAVMDVDFAPTGKEFVSGSIDRSVRIFRTNGTRSREIYTAPRMQEVFSVSWSQDNKFVMSGSNEMNIRLWKVNASEKMGSLRPREKQAFEYNDKLKKQYSHHPGVGRILRHRQIPKAIKHAADEHRVIQNKQKRKEKNLRANRKKDIPFTPFKEKVVVKEGITD
uniref:Sof1 domain-containing protein n=1 Tax=Panagrellus redivivus TaxID=6233 RepID=A0A7E4W722_PANRE